MSGDPDLATTAKAIRILDKIGADVIELGVPYSVSTCGNVFRQPGHCCASACHGTYSKP